jgi:hypothetical protein
MSTPPQDEDETATQNTKSKRWLKCQLCVTKVGEAWCMLEEGDSSKEALQKLTWEDSWAQVAKPDMFARATDVEVELWVGHRCRKLKEHKCHGTSALCNQIFSSLNAARFMHDATCF